MNTNLNVLTEERPEGTLIKPLGPVDSATFDDFKAALEPLLRKSGSRLVVDCSSLSYVNSKGIGFLATMHRKALVDNGKVVFFGLSPRIAKTLDLLGLSKRLFVETDEAAAWVAVQAPVERDPDAE